MGGGRMNPLLEHIEMVCELTWELDSLMERIGRLDDVYESSDIDCRIQGGAYQLLGRAIGQLENYKYELKNGLIDPSPPASEDN